MSLYSEYLSSRQNRDCPILTTCWPYMISFCFAFFFFFFFLFFLRRGTTLPMYHMQWYDVLWYRLEKLVVASLGLCYLSFQNSDVTAWGGRGRIHQERNFCSDQMESSLFLKVCKEGASKTSWSNEFQLSTTLKEKKCCCRLLQHLDFFSLYLCPLGIPFQDCCFYCTVHVYTYLSQSCHPFPDGTSYLVNLCTWVFQDPWDQGLFVLLVSGHPRLTICLFGNVLPKQHIWTLKCGCTRAIKSSFMLSLFRNWKDLVLRPRVLFALLTCASTCLENFRSASTSTPRSISTIEGPKVTLSPVPSVFMV